MEGARDRLLALITGYRAPQMIRAAALLRICDGLATGPRHADDIAAASGVDPTLLRRLMRALVGIGVLEEGQDGRFSNTAMGELLRSNVPGNLAAPALNLTSDHNWRAWGQLYHGILDGSVPYVLANDVTYWSVLSAEPEAAARFNAHMVSQSEAFATQLVNAFDFAQCKTVVDVGGGKGALIAGVLAANPKVRGVLFDLEQGLDGALEYLKGRGVADRCALVTGDFFESVPPGGDCYLLRFILHDWDDPAALRILESVRHTMNTGARLLVIDHLLPARADASPESRLALNMDMHMFVNFGSRERTEDEIRQMLSAAGFMVERVAPTAPPRTVIAVAV